jgi:ABC-type nitrate/sulfonate/bicarbonate transport system ATPase subunit
MSLIDGLLSANEPDVQPVSNAVTNLNPNVAVDDYQFTKNENLLRITGLGVSFGDKVVLRDVNLDLRNIVRPGHSQGQVTALIAPSGMGKTQLFRCIAGIQVPTTGAVFINTTGGEVDPATQTPVRPGQVGVVAQNYPLFMHLTVMANLLMAAKKREKNTAHAKAICLDYLERFGLSDRADVYPHQLSGGQRQRVAIIQQMVSCGHMLLMDEPFSGLDILVKEKVENLIKAVAAQDELNTVIITTHDIQAAIACADTILLMGRERDPETNAIIPGAKIVEEIDLASMGLTWRPNVTELPQFFELEKMIKARFHDL